MATTQYSYKVRDTQGKLVEGKVEAASEVAVADKLRAMGYVPLEVKAANAGMQKEITFGRKKRVKLKDLAVFCRQFATMIDAGLPLVQWLPPRLAHAYARVARPRKFGRVSFDTFVADGTGWRNATYRECLPSWGRAEVEDAGLRGRTRGRGRRRVGQCGTHDAREVEDGLQRVLLAGRRDPSLTGSRSP